MAILCNQVSKSIEASSSSRRIKQRDYTIPVRLNQLPPSSSKIQQVASMNMSQVNHNNKLLISKRRDDVDVDVNVKLINQQHKQRESHLFEPVKKMINHSISMKMMMKRRKTTMTTTTKKTLTSTTNKKKKRFLPSALVVVVVAAACCAINTVNICYCDTKTTLHSSLSSSSSSKNRPISSSSSASPEAAAASLTGGSSSLNLSQKENLLTALSDNIERQHFIKMKHPARALIQQRPSKFDSAEYLAGSDLVNLDSGIDYIKKKAQPLASIKKVDDSMRQILRMHEHAAIDLTSGGHQTAAASSSSGAINNNNNNNKPFLANLEQSPVKRWRKITRSPLNSLVANPNKVVSKVLAYVTPLVSSKLADSSILGQKGFILKSSTNSTTGPRIKLHPFVARSNNQASLSKSLMKISFRPYATVSPETSSLIRPTDYQSNKLATSQRQQYSTPPSTSINHYKDSFKSSGSGGGSSVDSIINDLMADSSDNSIAASIEAASAGISSHLASASGGGGSSSSGSGSSSSAFSDEGSSKKPETPRGSGSNSLQSTRPQTNKNALGYRLKKGANQLAQNYFQNSFRDLITLSQLPILSTSSPSSTAPSVLEKKRKPNKVDNKVGGSKFRRRRLIEDLYRYAYMLSTGVRNKRDPLEALGSAPNPLLSSSSSSLSQKSVLSQRSINQLMATNHNQMLTYVRKLRSLLPVGPMNKAKPRGVMWDMATDPSLAVTVFHLLERASVALPLGFLLLPVVQMIRHPLNGLNGLNLGRILPARASHRSVDIEELAKRLDIVDKMLSRALRSTHRESVVGK